MIMKKTGIMGGTFDPPHIAHLAMAQRVYDCLGLDEVCFIPAGKIPHKDSSETASAEDRLEMVRLSVMGNPCFSVDPIEIERGGYSYTFETLEALNKNNSDTEFTFIVGADSLDYMERWREPERIFRCCKIAAVSREGFSDERMLFKKRELEKMFNADIEIVTMPLIAVSSTELRNQIRRGGSVRYLVRDEVLKYILKKGIYMED